MFFVTSDHIPEGVGFQTFGLTHILWLLAGFVFCVAACIFYRRLSADKRKTALTVLGVIAFAANRIIGPGANYLFLAKPEDTPSILDILPPNFLLRLVVMVAVVSMMFFLSYLPWLLKDRKAKKMAAVG